MIPAFVCPVCELPLLAAPPEYGPVCPACGTEFEVDDRYQSFADLKRDWIENGAPWFSSFVPPPPNWSEIQLRLLEHAVPTTASVKKVEDHPHLLAAVEQGQPAPEQRESLLCPYEKRAEAAETQLQALQRDFDEVTRAYKEVMQSLLGWKQECEALHDRVRRLEQFLQHKPDCEIVAGTRYTHADDWGHLSYKYRIPGDECTCGLATLTQPGAAPRVTFTVRCNYCGHLPCDCTEQPGTAREKDT